MGALTRAISKKTACASPAKTFVMACLTIALPTGGTGMGGDWLIQIPR